MTSLGYTFGERSLTALDFYNTAEPRPDYYRYLPSYYPDDPALQQEIANAFINDPGISQINWGNIYQANRTNLETFYNVDGVAGKNLTDYRSRYILERRVTDTRRASARTVLLLGCLTRVKAIITTGRLTIC
jgi:hypothetical protein